MWPLLKYIIFGYRDRALAHYILLNIGRFKQIMCRGFEVVDHKKMFSIVVDDFTEHVHDVVDILQGSLLE